MNSFKINILASVFFMLLSGALNAQVLDGVYIKERTPLKKVVPLPHLREADVMYGRRVWREIILTEKQNHPLYYPIYPINDRMSLYQVIKKYALESEAWNIYSNETDEFTKPLLTMEERKAAFSYDFEAEDENGNLTTLYEEYKNEEILRYRLKEEWIFDKQRSEFKVRIIGIAPMAVNQKSKLIIPMFWLYFPEWRHVFVNHEVFNRKNDAERRTFDDIFLKRQFSSYIIKESNVFDRNIAEKHKGLDALLESERIKQELFNFEHDLWEY